MFPGAFVSWWCFFQTGWGEMRAQGPGLPTYLEHYCHHEEIVSKHQNPLQLPCFEAKSCRRAHMWGLGKGLDPSWASLPSSLWPYRILEHWWNPGVQCGDWGTRTEPAAPGPGKKSWVRPCSPLNADRIREIHWKTKAGSGGYLSPAPALWKKR